MSLSSIDSTGIIKILFGNNCITTEQSISELYHNADDANASKVSMYCKEMIYGNNIKDTWFIFDDNGDGMSLKNMETYLTLLKLTNNKVAGKHGKYSFGGKQAVLQLAGLTTSDKSDRIIIITKKESDTAVCCEFVINKLLLNGWSNQIEPMLITDRSLPTSISNILDNSARFMDVNYHGTTIFISVNNIIKQIFDDDSNNIKYTTSINFYKRLIKCEFWVGKSYKDIQHVKLFDPLYYNDINNQYKKTTTIDCYKDDTNMYFVVGDKYLRVVNKLGHTCSLFETFEKKIKKIGSFKFLISMLYELIHNKTITEEKINRKLFLSRNDVIIGSFNPLNYGQRVKKNKHPSRYCNMRIEIQSNSNLNDTFDTIFGVNMNKGVLHYNSLPKILRKTMQLVYDEFCKNLAPIMEKKYPYVRNLETKINEPNIQPIIKKDIQPIIKKDIQPIIKKDIQPIIKKDIQPIIKKDIQPIIKKDIQPIIKKDTKLIVEKDIQPIIKKDTKLIVEKKYIYIKNLETKITEKDIQKKLHNEEGGHTEVSINGRFIDLLTDKHIIEIKNYRDRLDSLKILYYYMHYPTKIPRIHLFMPDGQNCPNDHTFESICKKYNITLTYENKD
jgi:hypothetical protein